MLSLLADLDTSSYTYRSYIVSSGDSFSAGKVIDFEQTLAAQSSNNLDERQQSIMPCYTIKFVPRARKIHQSLLTAPVSSLQCFIACISILVSQPPVHGLTYPDLILLNGPSTSVIVQLAALSLRFIALPGTRGKLRSIYVESWARVKGLSLSGRILVKMGAVDRVLVQWEELAARGNGEFRGCLVR